MASSVTNSPFSSSLSGPPSAATSRSTSPTAFSSLSTPSSSSQPHTNNNELTIAIDFGTAFSRISLMHQNRAFLIPNHLGHLSTPSIIAFPPPSSSSSTSSSSIGRLENVLVGEEAMKKSVEEPQNCVWNLKRLLSHGWGEKKQKEKEKEKEKMKEKGSTPIQQYGAKAVVDEDKSVYIERDLGGGKRERYSPDHLIALFLSYLKSTALASVTQPIKQFILTVPSCLGTLEREQLREACEESGLSVLRLLNDTNAAAIAYGLESGVIKEIGETNVLVLSWGAGVCSCSLVSMEEGVYEVLGTGGDAGIGGEEFTMRLVNACLEEIRNQQLMEVEDQKALRRLYVAVEQAKIELSTYTSAIIDLPNLLEGFNYHTILTRAKFELLCAEDFSRCLLPIQQALAHAKLTIEQVDQVVLVGGSSRIPRVQQIVQQIFGGKVKGFNVERDESVAFGTAIYASMVSKPDTNSITDELLLMDVNPYSLSVNAGTKEKPGEGGQLIGMIEKNVNIPCRHSQMFNTWEEKQDHIVFRM